MLAAARRHPDTLFIGLDTNIAALRAAGRAAQRKPARGGAANAAFVAGSFEDMAGPLIASAAAITVYLPWGSLLAGVLSSEGARSLRALATPRAELDIVVSHDPARDRQHWERLEIDPCIFSGGAVERFYALAGWSDVYCRPLPPSELRTLGTTWASKLAMSRTRRSWRLTARA